MSSNEEDTFYTIDMPSDVEPPADSEPESVDPVVAALEENKKVVENLQSQVAQYAQSQEQMSRDQKIGKIDDLIDQAKDASDFETHARLTVEKNNLLIEAQPPAEPTMTLPEHKFLAANSWWDEDAPEAVRLKNECLKIEKAYAAANPNVSQSDALNYVHARVRSENPDNEMLGNLAEVNEEKTMIPSNNMINTQKYTKQVKIDKSNLAASLSETDMAFLKNKQAKGDSEESINRWVSARVKERQEGNGR